MGNGMPFVLEKGPVWDYFDRVYAPGGARGDAESRLKVLNDLRTTRPVDGTWADVFFEVTTAGLNPTVKAKLRQHIEKDWFVGLAAQGDTHGWLNWDGNPAELIVRALARAYEVSLGIERHVELPGLAPLTDADKGALRAKPGEVNRIWPIEFWWACPLPVFQCWIGWRRVRTDEPGEGDGLVTFTWATPAPAWSYLASKPAEDGVWIDENDVEQPGPLGRVDTSDEDRLELYHRNMAPAGLLLVGHEETKVRLDAVGGNGNTLERTDKTRNELLIKLPVLEGCGQIVTVSPFNDVGGYAEAR